MSRFRIQRSNGFTLIEVLVSTIILAIGLLGLASMQTLALKDNQDAFFYAQASSLAYEMSDRIKVNADEWKNDPLPEAATDCSDSCNSIANTCTPGAMAQFDYCAWKNNVKQRIAEGASATVAISPVSGSEVCTDGSGFSRCITVSWARSNQLGAAATNKYEMEMMP